MVDIANTAQLDHDKVIIWQVAVVHWAHILDSSNGHESAEDCAIRQWDRRGHRHGNVSKIAGRRAQVRSEKLLPLRVGTGQDIRKLRLRTSGQIKSPNNFVQRYLPANVALVPVEGEYTGVGVAHIFGKAPDVDPILAHNDADHEASMRLSMLDALPALEQLHDMHCKRTI
jgi:hypothetical protein